MSSKRLQVLVTRKNDWPLNVFNTIAAKCDIEFLSIGSPSWRARLLDRIPGKHALICMANDVINQEVLDKAGAQLRVIATVSMGCNHLDLNEIKKRGIIVGYTPDVSTAATAELTVALTLATARRLFEANRQISNGIWLREEWGVMWTFGDGLIGAKVGIVGLGRIGLAVAKRLLPFEVDTIMYTATQEKPEADLVFGQFVSFDQLLRESDVIIVTCSLNESTVNLFGSIQFALMKPNAIFNNTSRGGVVNQDALCDALKNRKIAAAGLDVMIPEPLAPDHQLNQLSNCVLLPHIGSATTLAREAMLMMTVKNVVNGLEDVPMPNRLC